MAGFSIMLMNFVLMPMLVLIFLAVPVLLFGLGGLAAAGVIFLARVVAGRRRDRALYVRAGDAEQVAAYLRYANARDIRTMRSENRGPALVKASISAGADLEELMARIAAVPGVQGMYVE